MNVNEISYVVRIRILCNYIIHYDTLCMQQCVSFALFCGGVLCCTCPCSVEHRRLLATAETRHHHDVCSAAERHRTAEGGDRGAQKRRFNRISLKKMGSANAQNLKLHIIGLLLDEFPLFSYDCIFRYVLLI